MLQYDSIKWSKPIVYLLPIKMQLYRFYHHLKKKAFDFFLSFFGN